MREELMRVSQETQRAQKDDDYVHSREVDENYTDGSSNMAPNHGDNRMLQGRITEKKVSSD